jgi:hypothetical protein
VVNFKIGHRAARLASPAITSKHSIPKLLVRLRDPAEEEYLFGEPRSRRLRGEVVEKCPGPARTRIRHLLLCHQRDHLALSVNGYTVTIQRTSRTHSLLMEQEYGM